MAKSDAPKPAATPSATPQEVTDEMASDLIKNRRKSQDGRRTSFLTRDQFSLDGTKQKRKNSLLGLNGSDLQGE